MKHLKQVINEIRSLSNDDKPISNGMLFDLICYPPKMPLRLHQEQLLEKAEKQTCSVFDKEFSGKDLKFNVFTWGSGKHKILLTHGWGSKASDLSEIIIALQDLPNTEIIAFDAPGNGSSQADLSNLILYVGAVKEIIAKIGNPDIFIGHSLGAMANIMSIQSLNVKPSAVISITPLIRLKENFIATLNSANVKPSVQDSFFEDFEHLFGIEASYFNLNTLYDSNLNFPHLIAYDEYDLVSPYDYLKEFITNYSNIQTKSYPLAGHEKILRNQAAIADITDFITKRSQSPLLRG